MLLISISDAERGEGVGEGAQRRSIAREVGGEREKTIMNGGAGSGEDQGSTSAFPTNLTLYSLVPEFLMLADRQSITSCLLYSTYDLQSGASVDVIGRYNNQCAVGKGAIHNNNRRGYIFRIMQVLRSSLLRHRLYTCSHIKTKS